ncbi:MAG: YbgA family protein [Candidatus Nitrosotenuis sp.]|uniref:DUF1722 domain-containing protein n=1 Tax=Candidatus Nitrosotenuis uzonensis TaxID=1407055 RepID=A0A812F5R9_9ARCH|nr:YbgA family protein [Candidatus Nitrosotenuis uzonensis]CAE6492405.1 conserved hypothetical protein [Candidatus Nitrosotenuis uzonensis]
MNTQKNDSGALLSHNEIRDYVIRSFIEAKNKGDINELVHFHSINKFLLLAHSQDDAVVLGRLVANKERLAYSKIFEIYGIQLEKTLNKEPTVRTHSNVIQKTIGYFKKDLSLKEKQSALTMLSMYRLGQENLESLLLFLDDLTRKFQKTYLVRQTYFLLYVRVKSQEFDSHR